jgi:hypothetical protein
VKEWLEREIGLKVNVKKSFKINNACKNRKLGAEEELYAK